jgi:hypothetical protein
MRPLKDSLRKVGHRELLYFFGPNIEISVFIPENKAKDADRVIQKDLE